VASWFNRYRKLAPIVSIYVESVRFDTQALENPDIEGLEYLEEILIEKGTGVLTLFEDTGIRVLGGPYVHYYLEVASGSRLNVLSLGEVVLASGKDSAGATIVPSGRMETVNAGTPAVFRGPYGTA
jgi:hypothetical protein